MIKRIASMFALTALMFVTVFAQDSAKRPATADDQLNMVRVGGALMSPDGEWVFYSKSELDWKKNKRKSTYYRVSASGGEPFRYIGEEGGSAFTFSPKGTYLSFLRPVGEGKEKASQIFIMRTDGGEAVQLTKHDKGLQSFKWSQDEERIFFLASEPLGKKEEKRRKDGYDSILVDEGPNGQSAGKWRNLWVFDLKEKKETKLTDEEHTIGGWDPSPDGKRVLYTARFENRRNQGNLSEIYLLDVESKKSRRLTDNKAPESGPVWAPDGKSFLYMASDDKEWELRNAKIWRMNPDNGDYRMISQAFEGNIRGPLYWSPDASSVYFTGLQRTDSNLFRLQVKSGRVEKLTDWSGTMSVSSFSKDRTRFVCSRQDYDTPPDLWTGRVGGGDMVRLTEANPWIEKELILAQADVVRWKSSDGLEIEGLLHLPPDYSQGQRLPLMLNIHGGPAGVFVNRFDFAAHIYAGLGYVNLSPNVRGSSGYSDELLRGNMRDIGGGDYRDLISGVDYAIEQGWADPQRLALRGWSYGGILGGWTITQTDRFKAASLGAMVSDWTSEYGPGFNHDVRLWYIGGTPWENPEGYRQKSSLTHIANVSTPTILFHGMRDTVDTEPQSMMYFAALKDRGVKTRYVRFPREGHGLREPRHARTRFVREVEWMQRHVLGQEWEPWEREEEKDKKEDEEKKAEEVEVGNR